MRHLASIASAIALGVAVAACGGSVDGSDRGVIRENVIEPGITAIEQASDLACGADAEALRTALEAYELLEGAPAADEAALIDAGRLREASELYDVVDGRIVPAASSECPPVDG